MTVSWVLNAYLIILVSLLLAASRLGDMKGYRNIFIGGFALFTARLRAVRSCPYI